VVVQSLAKQTERQADQLSTGPHDMVVPLQFTDEPLTVEQVPDVQQRSWIPDEQVVLHIAEAEAMRGAER
jgi:hypothetical protein